jgi:hypothetical protein
MHGPALPVAILIGLHLIEARVFAQNRFHTPIVSPQGCGFNASFEDRVWGVQVCEWPGFQQSMN